MFYSHDLLRLNGKFAVVWLLGNAPGAHSANRRRSGGGGGGGRVSKSDVLRTDIGAVCLEICALLPVTSSNRGHVSLRMAATLYLGTVDCHARQVQFLIRDMRLFKPLKHQPGAKGAGGAGGPIDCDGGPITLADLDLDGDTVRAKKKKSGANTVGRRCPRGAAAVTLAAPQMGDEADLNGTLAGAGRFCVPEEQITIREPQDLRFGGMGLEEEEGDFGFGETLGTTQGKALEDATAFQGILGEDDDEEDYGLLGDVQPPQAITEPDKEGDEDGGMERLEEANGTKQHPKKSEEPGAPKRPRSPRRREDEVTRAETPDEEGEDGKEKPKKRRRRDNRGEGEEEELLTPPPFPDMPQEEEEAEGVARGAPEAQRQQEEERDTGSPLPTLATPQGEETLGGTRRKKRGGKKKRQLVDKSKEMQRRDFEKNLADVGDIMTDGAVLPNPGRLSLRMGNNNWLRETTRRLGNAELREECLERMVAKVDLVSRVLSSKYNSNYTCTSYISTTIFRNRMTKSPRKIVKRRKQMRRRRKLTRPKGVSLARDRSVATLPRSSMRIPGSAQSPESAASLPGPPSERGRWRSRSSSREWAWRASATKRMTLAWGPSPRSSRQTWTCRPFQRPRPRRRGRRERSPRRERTRHP